MNLIRMKNNENVKKGLKGFVYVAVGVAAIGGLLFGYDTGVISGAILFIQKQYGLSATMEEVVVSSVLVGAIIRLACLFSALLFNFRSWQVLKAMLPLEA